MLKGIVQIPREVLEVATDNNTIEKIIEKKPIVKIGYIEIPVEVVRTDEAIRKGLSGRSYLPANMGMLFVFNEPDIYHFWMPDMHFSIDIIWIENDKIVAIHKDVSPQFDPKNPRFYSPPKPVSYVLELNAGFTENNSLSVGDTVIFVDITL